MIIIIVVMIKGESHQCLLPPKQPKHSTTQRHVHLATPARSQVKCVGVVNYLLRRGVPPVASPMPWRKTDPSYETGRKQL